MGGKVSYFLQGFITKLMDNTQATTMQGFDPNNQEVTTEMNTNELEENLATIVKYLGQENIKKFYLLLTLFLIEFERFPL